MSEQPRGTRVAVLPPTPALLPSNQGRVDPVADLRAACRQALAWLLEEGDGPVSVLADPPDDAALRRGVDAPLGLRVARALLGEVPTRLVDTPGPGERRLLVFANGSACRNEKAPGHFDPRSFPHDERIENALAGGDRAALAALDPALGRDLLAAGIEPLRTVGAMRLRVEAADLLHADDPYGVRYWVTTWLCRSDGHDV